MPHQAEPLDLHPRQPEVVAVMEILVRDPALEKGGREGIVLRRYS